MQELTAVSDLIGSSTKDELTPVAPVASNLEQLLPHIKLEHERDLDCWLPTTEHPSLRLDLNSTRLLLQGSDDPLISHGAPNDAHDDDHPFRTLLERRPTCQEQPKQHKGTCSPLTKQQLKANLLLQGSRKAKKLQQPVVFEAASPTPPITQQTARATAGQAPSKSRRHRRTGTGTMKLRFHHQALPAEYAAHYEATQGRQLTSRPLVPQHPPSTNHNHENVRSWLRKIAEIQRNAEQQKQPPTSRASTVSAPKSSSLIEISDATYPMVSVPLPVTVAPRVPSPETNTASSKQSTLKYADLPYMGEITLDNYKPRRGRKPKKADICHLIYKNYGTIVPATATEIAATDVGSEETTVTRVVLPPSEEPLNLCVRDQGGDRYSISSSESDKPTDGGNTSQRTTPFSPAKSLSLDLGLGKEQSLAGAKLLLQPVGLYYQQLLESCSQGGMPVPVETIEKDNQLSLKIPIPSGFFANDTALIGTRKRKRSAIFIPPMPAENSSSPSTEVSICKFKFTGGAKPTLQEKKMLSVDAEGNYRYYNGTGDKTLRGYEFISRDQQQLQQQQKLDKLYIDVAPPSVDLSLELLHIPPEPPATPLLQSHGNHVEHSVRSHSPNSQCSSTKSPMLSAEPLFKVSGESDRKRRSSRRSKQREKLEKTFKEKGFLIQTQQLQSAEGSTYCKFRQLKKFTRYLFRNWKDHIPDSDLGKRLSTGQDGDEDKSLNLESLPKQPI
ncbi:hypothetical protein KR018_006471 [Drosophila ironensis]|nr:hypothetical protein KR018_006471 [Drosophila ironensis]